MPKKLDKLDHKYNEKLAKNQEEWCGTARRVREHVEAEG